VNGLEYGITVLNQKLLTFKQFIMYYLIILAVLAILYMVFILPKMMKKSKQYYEEIKTEYTGKEDLLRKELFSNTFSLQKNAFNTTFTAMAECENHRTGKEAVTEFAGRAAQTLAKRALVGHGGQNTAKSMYHSFLAFDATKLYYIENKAVSSEISKQLDFVLDKIENMSLDFNKLKYTHTLHFSYDDKKYKFSIYDGAFPCLAGVLNKSSQQEAIRAKFALGDPFITQLKELGEIQK